MSAQIQDVPRPSWLYKELFPFQSHQIRILDNDVHYIDEGQGPTLLLLHGNGSWSYGFRYVIPALSSQFRVIALDYPGMGLSRPRPGYSFKPSEHSSVVEAFVEALGLRDIRLMVEDWGGPIGLGFAGRRPDLIHSLIITNTWAWPAQDTPGLRRFSKIAGSSIGYFLITRFNLLARWFMPYLAIARKMTAKEHAGYYKPYPTRESRLAMAIFPREILASHAYLAQVEDGLKRLASKPVLLLWGEQDGAFGRPERERFLRHFSHASVVLLPYAKHFVHLDEPTRTADAIFTFETKSSED